MSRENREEVFYVYDTWVVTLLNKAFYRRMSFTSWVCKAKSPRARCVWSIYKLRLHGTNRRNNHFSSLLLVLFSNHILNAKWRDHHDSTATLLFIFFFRSKKVCHNYLEPSLLGLFSFVIFTTYLKRRTMLFIVLSEKILR